jgi:hypothetical protein
MYTKRWSDLLVQSAAVEMFMPRDAVHKFTDWTYEHALFCTKKRKNKKLKRHIWCAPDFVYCCIVVKQAYPFFRAVMYAPRPGGFLVTYLRG